MTIGYRSTCYLLCDWYSLWPAEARQWSRRRRLTRPNITLLHTLHRLLGPSAHYTILSSTHKALIQALGGTAGSYDVTDICDHVLSSPVLLFLDSHSSENSWLIWRHCVTCCALPFCCSWIHSPLIMLCKKNSWLMWRHRQLNSPLWCSSIHPFRRTACT